MTLSNLPCTAKFAKVRILNLVIVQAIFFKKIHDSFGAMRNTLHGVHTHTTFIILDRHYSWPSTTVSTVTDMMVLRPPCCTPPSPTALTSPVCLHTPYSRHSFWSGCKQIASSWCFAILFVCACVLLACVSSSEFFC